MTPPLPTDDVPWDAITRYVAGELPDAEAAELRRWIDASPDHAVVVEEFGRLWTASRAGLQQSWDHRAALPRIKRQPAGPASVVRLPRFYRGNAAPAPTRASRYLVRAAAAIVVLASGAVAWRIFTPPVDVFVPAIASSDVSTARGQRASLNLPDGSHVVLGPSSTLRYTVDRDRGPRTVELIGSAYFVVTHDAKRPFTVHTAYGIATDLGTRFDVRAYPADSSLAVGVAEGKVGLQDGTTLGAGQIGRVNADGRVVVQRDADLGEYLAWADGYLAFTDVPLRDAIAQLGRWYDLDIRLADRAIGDRRLTASFKDVAAPEMLRLVTASLDVTVEQRGRLVVLAAQR